MTAAALAALLLAAPTWGGGGAVAAEDALHPNPTRTMTIDPTWQENDVPAPGPGAGMGASRAHAGPAPDSLRWPAARSIETRVRAVVGSRWEVDPGRLVLEWGVVEAPWTPDRDVGLTVAGTGADGWWTVHFHHPQEARPDFALRVRAGFTSEVPVAARALDRGVKLRPEDIAWTEAPVWGQPGDAGGPVVEPGWVTRRVLRKGELLAPPAVEAPVLVKGGESVEIIWVRGAISLRLRGRALQSGTLGERVRVRTESGHRLVGTVDGPGRVVILESREAVA
jgi:flagella basal body P-ring formation protein FlgA